MAARELPSGTTDSVRTLRATDRLTGMPVLLHVLPYALSLPDLPDHPSLLPIVDSGIDGEQAYVVTELPPQATPATNPTQAARGALIALAQLHERGLVHGGISRAQLWSVDGDVVVAGAGLPWRDEPRTHTDDLRDLTRTLQSLGRLPKALEAVRDTPENFTATQALDLLEGRAVAPPQEESAPPEEIARAEEPTIIEITQAPEVAEKTVSEAVASADVVKPDAPAAPVEAEPQPISEPVVEDAPAEIAANLPMPEPVAEVPAQPAEPEAPLPAPATKGKKKTPTKKAGGKGKAVPPVTQTAEPPQVEPDAQTPIPSPPNMVEAKPPASTQPETVAPPAQVVETTPVAEPASAPEIKVEPSTSSQSTSGQSQVATSETPAPEVLTPPAELTPAAEPIPSSGSPVPAFSSAPAGTVETPQERRKRQNEERRAQAMLDAKAAAERKAQRLRAEAAARQETQASKPIRIGIPEGGNPDETGLPDDLPDWNPPADDGIAGGNAAGMPPRLRMRDVERLPASLRRPVQETPPEPPPPPPETGRLPSRRVVGEPIRIGWDEDDSWRVVKVAPAPPEPEPMRLPRWLLPLVAALLLIGGAIWAYRSSGLTPKANAVSTGNISTETANCCQVAFTVTGEPGKTVQIRVVEAPANTNLKPDQTLGTAPGNINFPAKGTYKLRIEAQGYAPVTRNINVPHAGPFNIGLGE